MAKKKAAKKPTVVVGDGTQVIPIKRNDIITDTSAPPTLLDLDAKDPDELRESLIHPPFSSNTIVFSMRMEADLLKRVKQYARELSFKEERDISYQKIINDIVLEKFPNEKNKGE